MTIERAIRLAAKWSAGHVCSLREGEAQEYHELCYTVLKDATKQEQECEWCYHFKHDSQYLLGMGDGMYRELIFKYCPMCGRKLGGK